MRTRQRRRSGNQCGGESIQQLGLALCLDQHFAGEILHYAAQTETLGQIEYESAIPHALHPPADQPAPGYDGGTAGMSAIGIHSSIVPLTRANIKEQAPAGSRMGKPVFSLSQ